MPGRWLQIKGDPSVRAFLFEQERTISVFDISTGRLYETESLKMIRNFYVKPWRPVSGIQ